MSLTNDQETRIRCLQVCAGSVSEAKQAYYWVMGEQSAAKSAIVPGLSAQQAREAAVQQRYAAQIQNDSFALNARNPNIGGGSGD